MAGGRPKKYTTALAEKICAEVALGKTLSKTLKTRGMPTREAVHNWIFTIPEFSDMYTRSRKLQIESMFDRVIEVSEEESTDLIGVNNKRMEIDTKKWFVSKIVPRIPFLKGGLQAQIKQIKDAYSRGEINEAVGSAMINMINIEANFVPLEEFSKQIALLREEIAALKK